MRPTPRKILLALSSAVSLGALSGCEQSTSGGTGGEAGNASTSSTSALSGAGGEGGGTTGPCGAMGEACCPGQACTEAETVCDAGVCTGCIAQAVGGPDASGGCVVTKAGKQLCWGSNGYDQVACGGLPAYLPREVAHVGLARVAAIDDHVCALTPERSAYCWGYNYNGAAGADPSTTSTQVCPGVTVALPGQIRQISVYGGTTLAVQDDGAVYGWGSNSYGQLFIGEQSDDDDHPTPTLLSWAPPSSKALALRISSCVLTLEKKVVCVGWNQSYQLGTTDGVPWPRRVEVPLEGIEDIDGGSETMCALNTSGEVWCWGRNAQAQIVPNHPDPMVPTRVPLPSLAKRIAMGNGFGCAILNDDSVYCFGDNERKVLGACDLGWNSGPQYIHLDAAQTQRLRAKQLAMGFAHVCALDLNDQLWCWGDNRFFNTGTTDEVESVCPPRRLSVSCE